MEDKPRTFSKAIRAYCLDCCGGSANEVKLCPAKGMSFVGFQIREEPKQTETRINGRTKTRCLQKELKRCMKQGKTMADKTEEVKTFASGMKALQKSFGTGCNIPAWRQPES